MSSQDITNLENAEFKEAFDYFDKVWSYIYNNASVVLVSPEQELYNTPGPECISSMGNNSNRLDRYSSKNCDQIFQNMTELDSSMNELFRYANSQLTNIYVVQYRRKRTIQSHNLFYCLWLFTVLFRTKFLLLFRTAAAPYPQVIWLIVVMEDDIITPEVQMSCCKWCEPWARTPQRTSSSTSWWRWSRGRAEQNINIAV